ncbi:hypothetical protein THASP1DRAFT_30332 [Thamnocephalis sphaerospora]|uniref:Arrestin C-terminal-like domain-containing protein n=1 Tax=Thamnocephalis sphaerospora TaxID=78915 RepID=A0A4P9XRB6_9FUNG|nr:hypothetical protein THASP1DRAFT_30332 [Thamnocephalis sphaerospora]|eukprot:RKP07860.1 hypothetical protein THASP1DRAFT_30332 [Thamnocephalis sphaerospora]
MEQAALAALPANASEVSLPANGGPEGYSEESSRPSSTASSASGYHLQYPPAPRNQHYAQQHPYPPRYVAQHNAHPPDLMHQHQPIHAMQQSPPPAVILGYHPYHHQPGAYSYHSDGGARASGRGQAASRTYHPMHRPMSMIDVSRNASEGRGNHMGAARSDAHQRRTSYAARPPSSAHSPPGPTESAALHTHNNPMHQRYYSQQFHRNASQAVDSAGCSTLPSADTSFSNAGGGGAHDTPPRPFSADVSSSSHYQHDSRASVEIIAGAAGVQEGRREEASTVRPFSPISLDAIDERLLQHCDDMSGSAAGMEQNEAHHRRMQSQLLQRKGTALGAAPMPGRQRSSTTTSDGSGYVSPRSSQAGFSGSAPLAFPLTSNPNEPTLAGPVPNPKQRTLYADAGPNAWLPEPVPPGKGGAGGDGEGSGNTSEISGTLGANDGPTVDALLSAKSSTRNSKFRLSIRFDRAFYTAGGLVTGQMEVVCQSSSVRIGEISIEIIGIEEITSDASIDRDGYWRARKATTSLAFAARLSGRLPSTYRSKAGSVRYIVSGTAQVVASGNRAETVAHTRSVCIYERWTLDEVRRARSERIRAEARKRAFLGGEGHLSCVVETPRRLVAAGGHVYVNLGVRNHTKKKASSLRKCRVTGIRFTLWHRSVGRSEARVEKEMDYTSNSIMDANCRQVTERIFRGDDWRFEPGEERELMLSMPIPSRMFQHNSLSLRNTALLEASNILQVALLMHLSKDLTVELPIYITHPSSWSDRPPDDDEDDLLFGSTYAASARERRALKRSTTKVYSAFYGANGIDLDTNVELPHGSGIGGMPETSDGASADSPYDTTMETYPPDSMPSSRPVSVSAEMVAQQLLLQQQQEAADMVGDEMQPLPAPQPPGWSGTPSSTFGRGLLPASLHVVNPDQSAISGSGDSVYVQTIRARNILPSSTLPGGGRPGVSARSPLHGDVDEAEEHPPEPAHSNSNHNILPNVDPVSVAGVDAVSLQSAALESVPVTALPPSADGLDSRLQSAPVPSAVPAISSMPHSATAGLAPAEVGVSGSAGTTAGPTVDAPPSRHIDAFVESRFATITRRDLEAGSVDPALDTAPDAAEARRISRNDGHEAAKQAVTRTPSLRPVRHPSTLRRYVAVARPGLSFVHDCVEQQPPVTSLSPASAALHESRKLDANETESTMDAHVAARSPVPVHVAPAEKTRQRLRLRVERIVRRPTHRRAMTRIERKLTAARARVGSVMLRQLNRMSTMPFVRAMSNSHMPMYPGGAATAAHAHTDIALQTAVSPVLLVPLAVHSTTAVATPTTKSATRQAPNTASVARSLTQYGRPLPNPPTRSSSDASRISSDSQRPTPPKPSPSPRPLPTPPRPHTAK